MDKGYSLLDADIHKGYSLMDKGVRGYPLWIS